MTRVRIHPGEVLREEFMRPLALSAEELAAQLNFSRQRTDHVLQEKAAITNDEAVSLARRFGTTAAFWMNLQAAFEQSESNA